MSNRLAFSTAHELYLAELLPSTTSSSNSFLKPLQHVEVNRQGSVVTMKGDFTWSPSGKILATVNTSAHSIRMLRSSDLLQEISTIELPKSSLLKTEQPLYSLAFSSNSRFLSISTSQCTNIWDFRRNVFKYNLSAHDANIVASVFPSENNLLTADASGVIRLWNLATSSPTNQCMDATSIKSSELTCCTASATKTAAGFGDGYLRIWELSSQKLLRSISVHGKLSINSACFSPKNPRLVMASGDDGRITLIDLASRSSSEPSATISVKSTCVTSLGFHVNAVYFAAGLQSGEVRIYDWRNTKQPVCRQSGLPSPVIKVEFEPEPSEGASWKESSSESSAEIPSQQSYVPTLQSLKLSSLAGKENGSAEDKNARQSVVNSKLLKVSTSQGAVPPVELEADSTGTLSFLESRHQQMSAPISLGSNSARSSQMLSGTANMERSDHEVLRQSVRPVTSLELQDALAVLKYDVHREVGLILHEQVRQFEIAKEDNMRLVGTLAEQLRTLLRENEDLRAENERLRRVF